MWVLNFYLDSYLIWVKFNFITKQIKQDCVPIKIKLWVRIKTRYEFVKGWEIILRVGKYFKKNIWVNIRLVIEEHLVLYQIILCTITTIG